MRNLLYRQNIKQFSLTKPSVILPIDYLFKEYVLFLFSPEPTIIPSASSFLKILRTAGAVSPVISLAVELLIESCSFR